MPEGYTEPVNEWNYKEEDIAYELEIENHFDKYKPEDSNVEYQPRMQREKYQISVWKVSNHWASRIKFNYFTPTTDKVKDDNFGGFELNISEDGNHIYLIEKFKPESEDFNFKSESKSISCNQIIEEDSEDDMEDEEEFKTKLVVVLDVDSLKIK